jgi:iron complex outermembrane recepter protein
MSVDCRSRIKSWNSAHHRHLAVVAILTASSIFGRPALASDPLDRTVDFNIAGQSLSQALLQFGQQAKVQIMLASSSTDTQSTKELKGTYRASTALETLLDGSGLSYRAKNNTITLTPAAASEVAAPKPFRLETSATSSSNSGAEVDSVSSEASSDNADSGTKSTETIIVTGTRLLYDSKGPLPVHSYDQEAIIQSGQTTLADFLNNQSDVSITNTDSENEHFAGRAPVQLHGLPADSTLLLIDGQRVERSYYGFFDLANIPIGAVERIDVLPVGASAIYGSNALAGAVNVVLKKDLSGLGASVRYGGAAGTRELDTDLSWGESWERGGFSLLGTYQWRDELTGGERYATSTTDLPAGHIASEVNQKCNPGTVSSITGANLPGLGSNVAAIPIGLTAPARISDFIPTAGRTNLCASSLASTLIAPTERYGLVGSGHWSLTDHTELFTQFLGSKEHQTFLINTQINLAPASYTLGASNPYNPFGEDVRVGYNYFGLNSRIVNDQSFIRPLVGIRGDIASGWTYEATASLSRDRATTLSGGFSPSHSVLQTALNAADPEQALNPFAAGAPGSPALLNAIAASTDATSNVSRYYAQSEDAQGFIRGPIASLPAGSLLSVIGTELVHETQKTDFGDGTDPFDISRFSYALFNEERVPLWGPLSKGGPDVGVSANLALRYDHSGDFGGKVTWQSGLEVRPNEQWLIRGSYATGYQAPQLQQTAGAAFSEPIFGVDPERNGEAVEAPSNVGPNAGLEPETGISRSLGMVYGNGAREGFDASLTWYSLSIRNYIFQPDFQTLINNAQSFPNAVIRAAPTPQDQQLGLPGVITLVNNLYFNFGQLAVTGVDADVAQRLQTHWGTFKPTASASYHYRWDADILPGSPSVSYVGQASRYGPGFTPRWKGSVGVSWSLRPLSASLTERYIGHYRDYQDLAPNNNVLGGDWYLDANVRYELGPSLLSAYRSLAGSYVELGGVNLTDRLPRYSFFGVTGYDPHESDIRGRFVYVGVGVKW